ncbi:hypothetical protein ACOI1H_21405 [Loktanella sp. DJP18]|uniref:hypothetical protein n=1 Tax=Loktanella sp. DJP18 TaxID=3409788 RepID=UPI003BB7067B
MSNNPTSYGNGSNSQGSGNSLLLVLLGVFGVIMLLSYTLSSGEPKNAAVSCLNQTSQPYPATGGGNIHCMEQTIQRFYPAGDYPIITVRDAAGKRPPSDYQVYSAPAYCDKTYSNSGTINSQYDVLACIIRDENGGSVWNMGPNALPKFAKKNAAGLILDIQ